MCMYVCVCVCVCSCESVCLHGVGEGVTFLIMIVAAKSEKGSDDRIWSNPSSGG